MKTGRFEPVGEETEFDYGFDFYAAHTLSNGNEFLLTAFEAMWERNYPTAVDGYAGSLVLPRLLSFEPPFIRQSFPTGLDAYEGSRIEYKEINGSRKIELPESICKRLRFEIGSDSDWSFMLDGGFRVSYFKDRGLIKVERKNMLAEIYSNSGAKEDTRYIEVAPSSSLKFDILVDGYLIDMLIDDGRYAFSSQFFGNGESSLVIFGDAKLCGVSFVAYSSKAASE